jgi:unsaturated rhamnogalacturonyl hydrolase
MNSQVTKKNRRVASVARIALLLSFATAAASLAFAADARKSWTAVADRLIETRPESYPFDWGEGVQMIGLMKAFERTQTAAYADFVASWAAFHAKKSSEELLGLSGRRPGYCGHWSPGTALLMLYQAHQNPEHLRMARMILDFIWAGAERSPEGGLGHWQGSHQLWVDTLYMACPLLAGFGKLDHQPDYIDDAARQLIVHAHPLQDPATGLFYHMWDWKTREHSTGLWGRGNGWVLMSLADTMEAMDRKNPRYGELGKIASDLSNGLLKAQDQDGMWHTIMDDPSAYPESSATSMAVYGLLKLVRLGALPQSFREPAVRAWAAVNERYVKDGMVTGVSAGTSPQARDDYGKIKVGSETWGTGAYLLAASEMDRQKQ